jgi:phage tail-like protein
MTRRTDWLVGQLPMGMLDDDFFVRFTSIFQEVATSFLEGADNISNVVDVTVAPQELVRWLGSWIGLESVDASLEESLQRRLVRQAGRDLAWRGTRRGLEEFLAVVTGSPVVVEESGEIGRAGHLGVRTPSVTVRAASTGWMSDDDFVALVSDEIPANVRLAVYVNDRPLWPRDTPVEPVGGSSAEGGAGTDDHD